MILLLYFLNILFYIYILICLKTRCDYKHRQQTHHTGFKRFFYITIGVDPFVAA
jgi:hypothetical protein